jgi:RHS repeat-associated protein
MDLKLDHTSRTVRGTRFYTFGGQTVAVREAGRRQAAGRRPPGHPGRRDRRADRCDYPAPDDPVRRRPRCVTGVAGDKGFVGGTQDTTTRLTHLGAREYDPGLGRFISVDPVFVTDDRRSSTRISTGATNPATYSDPSGLRLPDEEIAAMRAAGYDRHGNPRRPPNRPTTSSGGTPTSVCGSVGSRSMTPGPSSTGSPSRTITRVSGSPATKTPDPRSSSTGT